MKAIIRTAAKIENDLIINEMNRCFAPIREAGFDFKKEQRKIYEEGRVNAHIHTVATIDDSIIGVVGNLPYFFTINNLKYPFTFIGSVCVDPHYRGQGIMRDMMEYTDHQNYKNGQIFSCLTGDEKLYNKFGFYKGVKNDIYIVNKLFVKNKDKVSLIKYRDVFFNDVFELYNSKPNALIRQRGNFIESIDGASELYVVMKEGKFIGYLSYLEKKSAIIELYLEDNKYISSVLREACNTFNKSTLYIRHNILDKELAKEYQKKHFIKAEKQALMIKIYNLKGFLELLLEYNHKYGFISNDYYHKFIYDGMIYELAYGVKLTPISTDKQISKEKLLKHLFSKSGANLKFEIPAPEEF